MAKRLAGWYWEKSLRTRVLLGILGVCLSMGSAYWRLREVAIRAADHMTVTVTRTLPDTGGAAGTIVYRQTFGRTLTAEAEHLLNDEIVIATAFTPYRVDGGALYGGAGWHYHLAFTWHGVLVETVDVTSDHLPEQYSISALGLEAPWQVWDGTNAIMMQLVQASDGTIPPPTAREWPVGASGG